MRALELRGLSRLGSVHPGDDLASLVGAALDRADLELAPGDVLVVAQKIVSKAEGRRVRLADVTPSARARSLAAETDKDPRLVELILRESSEVLRHRPGLVIVRHRLGYVMANAGIDQSNTGEPGGDDGCAVLLPEDPDASATRLRAELEARHGAPLGVIVSDSVGRAWRNGTVGTALGVAGLAAVLDLRGRPDLDGRRLRTSVTGHADQIAAAAALVMGEGAEGCPAVRVRGAAGVGEPGSGRDLLRPPEQDLFQ